MPLFKRLSFLRPRLEWVEIVEPRSRERMFVNLVTGECGWDEPTGVTIKRLHEQDGHQWWELFDVKTSRFYYYNATTQQTCWQKPKNNSSIIIPLAKFQLLKQNQSSPSNSSTDAHERRDVGTQTRDTCTVLVNNSTQTTPPPSLRRGMVHYYSPMAGDQHHRDTWSAKRSLRSYLINEARHARGLTGLEQDEVSDFDDELWESDDDCDDASSTSDQWDADDEIEHDEDNDEDDDDDDDDQNAEHDVVNHEPNLAVHVLDPEYETENDDLDVHLRDSEKDSTDNQSFGSTYVDSSFVFVGPETSSSRNPRNSYSMANDSVHHSLTKKTSDSNRHSSASQNSFLVDKHPSSFSHRLFESPTPTPADHSRSATEQRHKQVAPQPPPHQPPVPPQRGLSLTSYELSAIPSPPSVASSSHSTLPSFMSSQERTSRTLVASETSSRTEAKDKRNGEEKKSKEKRGNSRFGADPEKAVSLRNGSASKPVDQQVMEKFARENVARHIKRGVGNQLLKRKTSLKAMLTWSKNSIKQPMIATLIGSNVSNSSRTEIKSEAITCFKLIQQFMGDRLVPDRKDFVPSSKEYIAFDLITRACQRHELRDEIYVQLCRQTTDNPRKSSLAAGFELMACCLCYFPPSVKFSPYLASFLTNSPLKDMPITSPEEEEAISLMNHCYKLLVKVRGSHVTDGAGNCGSGTIYCRKPVTPKELEMVGDAIDRRFAGIFGESVESLMDLQKKRWPEKRLPWILTTLCQAISKMGGSSIEGIFRIAADTDELSFIKLVIDCINFDLLDDDGDILDLLNHNSDEPVDVHVFACLLKQWFRSLREPIVPSHLYDACLANASDAHEATSIVMNQLPKDNNLILGYLIRFLQVFSAPENSSTSKMDDSNLSMIWAPNLLRSGQANALSCHPSIIFENTRKEMTFIRTLIQSLDTSYVDTIC